MKVSLPILLFIVFLILKLTHTIAWSWWWITAPLWGAVAIWLLMIVVVLIIAMLRKLF